MQKFSSKSSLAITELGGANSCFAKGIINAISPKFFTAIDNNSYGLELLKKRFSKNTKKINTLFADVLTLSDTNNGLKNRSDIVFSVGLIEHFNECETKLCIDSHFFSVKPGGIVLITFPTPTLLYRIIRIMAEMLGIWEFPDERPLKFEEVIAACNSHGRILHRSINWKIGLTQGYLVYARDDNHINSSIN